MKNIFTIMGSLVLLAGVSAHAAEEKEHPCQKIKAACEAAGFKKGDHKKDGKGLFADCMKKIKEGGSVEGVSVPADEVNACKEHMEKHREKREHKKIDSSAK
jgi:hypothetical protein